MIEAEGKLAEEALKDGDRKRDKKVIDKREIAMEKAREEREKETKKNRTRLGEK